MAELYTITGSEDGPLVLSATNIVEGTTVKFVTHPHEIECESALPRSQVLRIGVGTVVSPLAYNIEQLLTDGTVIDAAFVQATDANGLLVGAMDFTVGLPSTDMFAGGTLTATVRLTIRQLYLLSDNMHLFDEARARLEAMAAL